ncbi:Wzz/FepE/Etk N-terminal domain-containing protein [Nevskia ramosa]|uniref:Wzz/FepE/Etk N-terminal domain-containing protein n=1 Tax=Nevskia ramosa TaxID=64002 RepID=UPI0009FEFA1C|nr:Wzz/FepE/Etk N-terminal domain-containing protein [Nevskia ramosa]
MHDEIEDISLRDLARKLWLRRGLIAVITTLATAVAIATAFLLPEKFQASVVLSPVTSETDAGRLGGASALLSQFGGLAGISGLGGGGSSKKAEATAILQSSSLTEAFIQENNLLPVLFPKKRNSRTKNWNADSTGNVPTLWKGEQKFRKEIRSITEDKKTGLIVLTITWSDPEEAALWANELVDRANNYIRKRAIDESERNIEYLKEQNSKTSIVEIQRSIYSLTEDEIKKIMLASGSSEYAFRVIDKARVPEERYSPKRASIAIAGAALGLIIGCMLALLMSSRKNI